MELEAHVEELRTRGETLVEANHLMVEAADRRSFRNLMGILQPELYKTEGRVILELGKIAGSLLRLTPHIPELYNLHRSKKTGDI
jgi:hypothetical protein